MSDSKHNETLIISGETKKGIFTLDNQKINCIGDNAEIIHTGKNVQIYDNEGETFDPENGPVKNTGKGSLFIATGENSFIEASSESVSFASGKGAKVSLPYGAVDADDNPLLSNAVVIATGDEANATVYGSNCLGIVTGEGSNIYDIAPGSIGIATGNKSWIGSEDAFKKAVILGDESSVSGGDSTEFTAFSGGLQADIEIGPQSSLLSEFPVKKLDAGIGSVVVVGWHDGTRKRYSVYYEGVDFTAGKQYMSDELGQLHLYREPEVNQ